MKPRNSFDKAALAVNVICIALCVLCFPFLSDNIAIQWSGREVGNTANRLFIFVLPLISLVIYRLRFSLVSPSLARKGEYSGRERTASYIVLFVDILLLGGAAAIILFDRGIFTMVGPVFALAIAAGVILGVGLARRGA